jgi:predicted RND superfamily exporter protein
MKKRVLRHPGRWIWLPLLVLVVIGLARLRFDAEVFDLLPADLPVVGGLKLYERHFAAARDLMITLKGTDPDRVEATAREIAARLRPLTNLVASASWEAPWIEHPDQMAELMAYLWFNQPPEVFSSLPHRFAPDQLADTFAADRDQLATALSPEQIGRLSYDPLGLTSLPESVAGAAPMFGPGTSLFSSADGTFRVVFVRARSELRNYRDCENWLKAVKPVVRAAIATSEDGPGAVAVGYTGRPALVAEVAASMGHDIIASVGGTSAVIAVLFWLAHRRVKPMLWLLTLLAAVLGATLGLGGMIYGTINVISMGFAAILLGLAVDYAVVHYQEALAHPDLSVPEIRHAIAPSIFWAATTTITAFLVLNLGGLPGLAQLGTLVGLGVALAACLMIFEYLPPLFPDRREPRALPVSSPPAAASPPTPIQPRRLAAAFVLTWAVLVCSVVVLLLFGPPRVDSSADSLRPQNSPAYAALDQMQKELIQGAQPLWLIVEGKSVADVADRLERIQLVLDRAVSNQEIESFTLPAALWPRPRFQEANRATALQLGGQRESLLAAARANGFAPRSLALTEGMLATWREAGAGNGVFWPSNQVSQWIVDKVVARTPTNDLALGMVNAGANAPALSALAADLTRLGGHLSGWEMLGHAIFFRVKDNMWKVVSPMVCLVLLSLWLAFGRLSEVLLGLAVLALSGLCLLAAMRLAGWSWNLLNLMGVPLVLGTGVDYGLFTQLALRRHHGDLALAYRSVGRALLLCGGTAIAAFGSLAWSSNAGMASLGQVCAVGIACNMLIAVFLLPVWWQRIAGPTPST